MYSYSPVHTLYFSRAVFQQSIDRLRLDSDSLFQIVPSRCSLILCFKFDGIALVENCNKVLEVKLLRHNFVFVTKLLFSFKFDENKFEIFKVNSTNGKITLINIC